MNSSRRFELQEKRSGQERLFERLFMLGLSLGPVYLFPSGLPQVSDWLLAVWAGVTLLTRVGTARRVLNFGPMFFGALLTTYIILVNVVWALYLGDVRVAYNSLFYIFNFMVMWALSTSIRNSREQWRTVLSRALVIIAAVLLVMFALRFDPGRVRQTAGFNNPNQLAYYSLLLFCGAFVVFQRTQWTSFRFLFVIGISLMMILFSSSLSAIAGLSAAILGASLTAGVRRLGRFLRTAALITLVLGIGLASSGLYDALANQIRVRFTAADRKVANAVDERGYSRILEYPEYVILGAGEGARYRFGPEHSHELHSSLGTLLFSYGVPGLAFFLLMLLFVLRRKRFSVWLLTMAPLIYSLSHQGLRTTLFWIFLTIVWLYAPETRTAFAPWGSMLREISSTPGYTRARSN